MDFEKFEIEKKINVSNILYVLKLKYNLVILKAVFNKNLKFKIEYISFINKIVYLQKENTHKFFIMM